MDFRLRQRIDANCCMHEVMAADEMFVVLVETPDVPRMESLRLHLRAVMEATPELHAETPRLVADALHTRLVEARIWAMLSAVHVSRRRVTVCLAGAHRVHLLREGKLISSVREHIAKFDPQPGQPRSASEEVQRFYDAIVTRTIGGADGHSAPPEVTRWVTPPSFRVVMCTTLFNGNQEPETYLPDVDVNVGVGTLLVLDGTRAEWRDFTYREFHEVPRCILFTTAHGRQLFLDSRFHGDVEYGPDYLVYAVPSHIDMSVPWSEAFISTFTCVGTVPVKAMRFDATRRKQLDASIVLDALG